MAIHPEIAKILATLPAPDGSPLNPEAMRAHEESRSPRWRSGCRCTPLRT